MIQPILSQCGSFDQVAQPNNFLIHQVPAKRCIFNISLPNPIHQELKYESEI